MSEGFLRFRGHRTWYRVVGDPHSGRVPLLLLHGGPGMPGAASRLPFLRAAAYRVASIAFLHAHVCRLRRPPQALFRSLAGFNEEIYQAMWGPSEFFPTGTLASWKVEARLGEIDLPTLITSGRFDEATPAHMEKLRDGIPGSRWVCFEQSSHSAFIEEPERYRAELEDFLEGAEGRGRQIRHLRAKRSVLQSGRRHGPLGGAGSEGPGFSSSCSLRASTGSAEVRPPTQVVLDEFDLGPEVLPSLGEAQPIQPSAKR